MRIDLDPALFAHSFSGLKGAEIFITGGTGFFGTWLLQFLTQANDQFQLGLQATILTRDAKAFALREPALSAHPSLRFHEGSVESFNFPKGNFSHIIHGAASTSAVDNANAPRHMFRSIVDGTERMLDFARERQTQKFLFISSGAVYGKQPSTITHVSEDFQGGPDPLSTVSAYGEGKRAAEFLCAAYKHEFGLAPTIARCFAFVGPYLPIDQHFAIGNFIRDGLAGKDILIQGDGTPFRSYLYPTDLIQWLLTILLKGQAGRAYNVGSEDDHSIGGIAKIVAGCFEQKINVKIAKEAVPGKAPDRYVPSTARARTELGLSQEVPLQEAIKRTIAWHRARKN